MPLVENADATFFAAIDLKESHILQTLQTLASNQKWEVHETEPHGFNPEVQISACYLEIDGKLLLLQRAHGKLEPGKWGVPAGKLEKNETPEQATQRDLFEETGISFENLSPMPCLYIRKPEIDYIYHPFKIQLDRIPPVQLSNEHQNYQWVTSQEMQKLPLMDGAQEALYHYRKNR